MGVIIFMVKCFGIINSVVKLTVNYGSTGDEHFISYLSQHCTKIEKESE
jgi:hypothetical protein